MNHSKYKELKIYEILFTSLICVELGHFGQIFLEYSILSAMFLDLVFNLTLHNGKLKLYKLQFGYWKAIVVFTFWALFSYSWCYSKAGYFEIAPGLLKIIVCVLYVFYWGNTYEKICRLICGFCIGVCYMCLRLFIYLPLVGRFGYFWGDDLTRVSTGLQSNTVGQIAAFGIIFAFYFLLKNYGNKKIWISMVIVFALGIYLAGSRKGLLIPFVGTGMMMLLNKRYLFPKKNVLRMLVGIIITILVLFTLLKNNNELRYRMYEMIKSVIFGKYAQSTDGSIIIRSFLRAKAKYMFLSSPIIGFGLNSLAYYDYMKTTIVDVYGRYAHDNYWEMMSCLGIIGLLLYYVRYLYIILKLKTNKYVDKNLGLTVIVTMMIFEYGIVSYCAVPIQIVLSLAVASIITRGVDELV